MTNLEPNLQIQLGNLTLNNPIITASGTCGFGYELMTYLDELPGAMVLKGLTLHERKGNLTPRLVETPAGILNSIGLQNPGLQRFIEEYLSRLEAIDTTLIANISGNVAEDYRILAAELSKIPLISALEVNISCPNVKAGGMAFGTDPDMAYQVIAGVSQESDLPIIAKLSPNVTDICEIARAVVAGGADIISLINTLLGMKIDVKTRKPVLGNSMGGLSGPAIRPVAVRMVYQVAQAIDVPIIGMGGVRTLNDVIEMILAGASAVAVGTGTMIDPTLPSKLIKELEEYCHKENISAISNLIGQAL